MGITCVKHLLSLRTAQPAEFQSPEMVNIAQDMNVALLICLYALSLPQGQHLENCGFWIRIQRLWVLTFLLPSVLRWPVLDAAARAKHRSCKVLKDHPWGHCVEHWCYLGLDQTDPGERSWGPGKDKILALVVKWVCSIYSSPSGYHPWHIAEPALPAAEHCELRGHNCVLLYKIHIERTSMF